MTMRDQNAIQAFKPDASFQDLALRPLAAINQKAVLIVDHHLR